MQTDQAGRFAFPQIKPGLYTLTVEAPGFEKQVSQPISAGLGETATLILTMKLAEVKEEVTVIGEAPLINPENPNTSTRSPPEPSRTCRIRAAT